MLSFLKNNTYPIGVDMSDDAVKMVQLAKNGDGVSVIAGGSKNRPMGIEAGSAKWQMWAIEATRELTSNGKFKGKNVVPAMPASEVFIDHVRVPKAKESKLDEIVFSKIKQRLPFEPADALIKCMPGEDDNVLVLASEIADV